MATTSEHEESDAIRYVYHDERISLAVDVARAISRPLLVTGEPGSGKSTLARDVARGLGWAFLPVTFTSRTTLDDLVARFDAVSRLADAQTYTLGPDEQYLVPGALWWAFDGDSASRIVSQKPAMRQSVDPRQDPQRHSEGIVLLLDEIDKAEPDIPNDLLGPLDGAGLSVPGRQLVEPQGKILVIITSNGERAMPSAFLRRCVHLDLPVPQGDVLLSIARAHFGTADEELYQAVAQEWSEAREQHQYKQGHTPSVAEYLDTVRACIELGKSPKDDVWDAIRAISMNKFHFSTRSRW